MEDFWQKNAKKRVPHGGTLSQLVLVNGVIIE